MRQLLFLSNQIIITGDKRKSNIFGYDLDTFLVLVHDRSYVGTWQIAE